MNKRYRVVWSEASDGWVVVAENARARGKGCKQSAAAVVALFAAAAGSAQAGSPWSYSIGLLGDGTFPSECFNSGAPSVISTGSVCDGNGHVGAGFGAYDASGNLSAFAVAVDPYTVQLGAGGNTMLTLDAGTSLPVIRASAQLDMGGERSPMSPQAC
ncbi:ESPR domain-containing protein [Caballeronia sp. J97]|uniref:ESPR domain-containing protein n=1 Tax=Caballeronia sp. J97 TaxID=2805429 RepID=UPI002AAFC59F|nr:ESPR domain-containing protein [Caballeronia sp. J97]